MQQRKTHTRIEASQCRNSPQAGCAEASADCISAATVWNFVTPGTMSGIHATVRCNHQRGLDRKPPIPVRLQALVSSKRDFRPARTAPHTAEVSWAGPRTPRSANRRGRIDRPRKPRPAARSGNARSAVHSAGIERAKRHRLAWTQDSRMSADKPGRSPSETRWG